MNRRTLAAACLIAAVFLPLRADALETDELLALVAMPLAVAAVSEATDVPMNELMNVVTLLNDADVPPVQFVEVVRYAPVALVVEQPDRTPFVEFVRTRYESGVTGLPLVTEIEREIRYYGLPDVELDVVEPSLIERDFLVVESPAEIIPLPVRTRLAEHRQGHPHGGPPGQLKKELGLKTGAEVVHGDRSTARVRVDDDGDDGRRVTRRETKRSGRPARVDDSPRKSRAPKVKRGNDGPSRKEVRATRGGGDDGRGRARVVESRGRGHDAARARGKGRGQGGGNAGGGGKGKGKGKG